jgi:hypothetical protein
MKQRPLFQRVSDYLLVGVLLEQELPQSFDAFNFPIADIFPRFGG